MREKVKSKESFVIVGRCSEEKLNDVIEEDCEFIPRFIRADMQARIARIMQLYNLNTSQATEKIKRHDKNRKNYHNYFCDTKWGDARNYDLTINSARLGVEKTVKVINDYINERLDK